MFTALILIFSDEVEIINGDDDKEVKKKDIENLDNDSSQDGSESIKSRDESVTSGKNYEVIVVHSLNMHA